jgi:putative chitinase
MSNNLNQYCSGTLNDFITITKKINGGINGLEDRITKWNRAKSIIGC